MHFQFHYEHSFGRFSLYHFLKLVIEYYKTMIMAKEHFFAQNAKIKVPFYCSHKKALNLFKNSLLKITKHSYRK